MAASTYSTNGSSYTCERGAWQLPGKDRGEEAEEHALMEPEQVRSLGMSEPLEGL